MRTHSAPFLPRRDECDRFDSATLGLPALFSARYTTYAVMPWRHQRGRSPAGFSLDLTLALTHERDESGTAGPAAILPIIESALNRHAGGVRQFAGTPISVRWRGRWTARTVLGGRALGIAILNDDFYNVLERPSHPSVAQTMIVTGGDRDFARIIFRASSFTRPRRGSIGERQTLSTTAHELGHAFGLSDHRGDPRSTMYYAQLTSRQARRIDQRWSDSELRQALRGIFEGPGRIRPDWL